MSKIALVAGGTGLVGSHLVDLLIDNKSYSEVKVLIRKGSNYKNANANLIEVDYNTLEDRVDLLNADVVFCCLGTTIKKAGSKEKFRIVDFTYPLALAKIAKENNCEEFSIITAMGSNAKSGIFYNKVKGEVEDAICKLGIPRINIYRPSLLTGDRVESRMGEHFAAAIFKVINPLLVGGLKKYRSIEAKVVAKAMVMKSLDASQGISIIPSDEIVKIGQNH